MRLRTLIDQASAIVGSDYKLAQTLGVPRMAVSMWRHGHRPCPADLRAVMADIAGEDPEEELFEAIAERLSEDRKERLRQALRKRARPVHNPWILHQNQLIRRH